MRVSTSFEGTYERRRCFAITRFLSWICRRWHELRPREPEITMEYLESDQRNPEQILKAHDLRAVP
jgi:hypothetical protein